MTLVPVIETARLRLRPNRLEDFDAFAAFYASPRAELRGGRRDRIDAWRGFCAEIGHWQLRGYGFWGVEERATGAYVGQVGLYYPEGWPEPEIGWLVMEDFEGRGYAREAALASRAHAYGELGWRTAVSVIHADNTRSIRLAERLGAWLDGSCDMRGTPMLIYRHPGPEHPQ